MKRRALGARSDERRRARALTGPARACRPAAASAPAGMAHRVSNSHHGPWPDEPDGGQARATWEQEQVGAVGPGSRHVQVGCKRGRC